MQAQVDMLTHRWGVAEQKLVARGFVDDAIQAYLSCHKWREAIKVAQDSHHMDVGMYKQQYLQHLLDTKQHEEAGRLKEQEGDFQVHTLINLMLITLLFCGLFHF